ncbi:MAG: DnaB-like helicase C-terminal domain-containing protein [Planctomycetota bacterium]
MDWSAMARRFAENITDDQVQQLAGKLGVDPVALRELGIGCNGEDFTFAMFGSNGSCCGIRTRAPDGSKRCVKGSRLGIVRRLEPDDGLLLVCEGESDAAAALSYGFDAIGTPGAGQSADVVAGYAKGRDVVVVADRDDAGARGATKLQEALAGKARSVRTIRPVEPHKDLRAWRIAGATLEDINREIEAVKPAPSKAARSGMSPAQVLDRWQQDGALEHEPTGIGKFDAMTGGGPAYGTRMFLLGAPDAGKTALLLQIADNYLQRGIAVGLLGVDEEPGDLLQRILQRRGWTRGQCERRDSRDLAGMRGRVEALPLRLYDSTWTIEAAAADLAAFAKEQGLCAMLGVDSIQTAGSAIEAQDGSRYEAVTHRVQALRKVADEYRLIAIATSEMSRSSYRTAVSTDTTNDMAAAKESGAVEYSGRIIVSLRNIENESDLVELRVVKNKHGPSHRREEQGIVLRIDRARQELVETDYEQAHGDPQNEARSARRDRQTIEDAARLACVITKHAGTAARRIEEIVSASTPGRMGHTRFGAARGMLADAIVERPGVRTQVLLYLDGTRIAPEVLDAVPLVHRPTVTATRPPAETPTDAPRPPSEGSCPEAPRGAPNVFGAPGTSSSRESAHAPLIGAGAPRTVCVSMNTSQVEPPRTETRGTSDAIDDGRPEWPGGSRSRTQR